MHHASEGLDQEVHSSLVISSFGWGRFGVTWHTVWQLYYMYVVRWLMGSPVGNTTGPWQCHFDQVNEHEEAAFFRHWLLQELRTPLGNDLAVTTCDH